MTREEASYILRKFYADGYKSNNYNALEKALKIAVICLENLPHWISVEDEYPPFDAKENGTWRCSKDVLIFAPFRGVFVGRYECDDMYGKTYWLFNGGSYPTVERGDGYESSNVTHWMPLPQAPKEGCELSNGKEIEIECDYE